MQYNLEGRAFRAISNTNNGEVGPDTLFHDRQTADVVTATTGGASSSVTSFAKILTDGRLDMRYHHLNNQREFMLGKCISTPERLSDGRLRFTEHWQWLPGDMSSGHSETEEVERKAFV